MHITLPTYNHNDIELYVRFSELYDSVSRKSAEMTSAAISAGASILTLIYSPLHHRIQFYLQGRTQLIIRGVIICCW